MVSALLDTSILIDILRKDPVALSWYRTQGDDPQTVLGITPIAWMETVSGGYDKLSRIRIVKSLRNFDIENLTPMDFDWARDMQLRYQLSHGDGILDCLIAAPCARLRVPLYTLNLKHFAPILGSLTAQPY